jgi:hypothetical protein
VCKQKQVVLDGAKKLFSHTISSIVMMTEVSNISILKELLDGINNKKKRQ